MFSGLILSHAGTLTLTVWLQTSKTLLDSAAEIIYSRPMFDIVRPQIATAADKVSHLRRFL